MTELQIINTEGLPEGTTKIVLSETYDVANKNVYTIIWELKDKDNNKTEIGQRTHMYGSDDYNNIISLADEEKLQKVAIDYGWI